MVRALNRLNARKVETAPVGKHQDGGGLILIVKDTGSKQWVFRFKHQKRETMMGLGSYPEISLADARARATQSRQILATGKNPIDQARQQAEAAKNEATKSQSKPSFGQIADQYIKETRESWRNEKHAAQWVMTLEVYCKPMRPIPIDEIETEHVLKVLQPIWRTKPETAQRLRGRIEVVIAYAIARGLRADRFNPATWRGHLQMILPADDKSKRTHFDAAPYEQMPNMLSIIRSSESISARALEFTILTAARTGEVIKARWQEVDFDRGVWTRPAEHMKTKRLHSVPLSNRCIEILREVQVLADGTDGFIFVGRSRSGGLSSASLEAVLERLKIKDGVTVHGFRSSFRDWAGDQTNFPRDVIEGCLAHAIGDKTEAAYRRSDALEKRRAVMVAWLDHCNGQQGADVIPLKKKGL